MLRRHTRIKTVLNGGGQLRIAETVLDVTPFAGHPRHVVGRRGRSVVPVFGTVILIFCRLRHSRVRFRITIEVNEPITEDDIEQDDSPLLAPIKVHTVIADGFYLFNGKHYSHAAAYDQSVIQIRSAGSLMAGASYYHGTINYASDKNADLIYMMKGLGRIKLWQASVGAGYAYNWVPAKGLLVSMMAMPMLTFVNRMKTYHYNTNVEELLGSQMAYEEDEEKRNKWWAENLKIEERDTEYHNSRMTVGFDARLSLTYNFGRYFVSACGKFNNFRYRHNDNYCRLQDWYVNTSLGIRL